MFLPIEALCQSLKESLCSKGPTSTSNDSCESLHKIEGGGGCCSGRVSQNFWKDMPKLCQDPHPPYSYIFYFQKSLKQMRETSFGLFITTLFWQFLRSIYLPDHFHFFFIFHFLVEIIFLHIFHFTVPKSTKRAHLLMHIETTFLFFSLYKCACVRCGKCV